MKVGGWRALIPPFALMPSGSSFLPRETIFRQQCSGFSDRRRGCEECDSTDAGSLVYREPVADMERIGIAAHDPFGLMAIVECPMCVAKRSAVGMNDFVVVPSGSLRGLARG